MRKYSELPTLCVFMLSLFLPCSFAFAVTINIPNDYSTIQAGIDAANDGDTILISPGIYIENINFNGKNITVGSLFLNTADKFYISQTVIDGNKSGRTVTFENNETSDSMLIGLTIKNGFAPNNDWPHDSGAGIFCNNSSPILSDLHIIQNQASTEGGGIDLAYSNAIVKNSTIAFNDCGTSGGGVHIRYGNPRLINNVIAHNSSDLDGGGVNCNNASPTIINSTFYNNTSYNDTSTGIRGGGAIFGGSGSNPIIVNCILWNNTPNQVKLQGNRETNSVNITYTNIEDGEGGIVIDDIAGSGNENGSFVVWGDGNIDVDPMFVDSANNDFNLRQDSQCIDSGTSSEAPSTDIQGVQRPKGSGYDMGAYEAYLPVTLIPYTPDPTNDTTQTLEWNDVTGASTYTMQYSAQSDFNTYTEVTGLAESSYTISNPLSNGTWYWRVKAFDIDNIAGSWTSSDSFIVDTVPPESSILDEPDPYIGVTSTTMTVNGAGAVLYKYRLDNDENYSDIFLVSTEIELIDLTEGSHTIYVITGDAAGNWQSEEDSAIASWIVDTTLPIADAGPDQTAEEGNSVTLNGLNSLDPDSGITLYLWEQIDGTPVILSNNAAAQPTFTPPDVGPDGEALTFRLTIINNAGLESTDTCIVNISWLNVTPTANAGYDLSVEEEAVVLLDGSNSSDPDDGIESYLWIQTGGITITLSDVTASQPTFAAPNVTPEGISLTFQLTVTDRSGLQSIDTCQVNVIGDNDPPFSDGGPDQSVEEGNTVILDGSNSSDPDDGIHRYVWMQTAGTPVTLSDATNVKPTFVTPTVDPDGEQLEFLLTVIDNGGLQLTDTVSIRVEDNGITDFPEDVVPTDSTTGKTIGIKVKKGGAVTSFITKLSSSIPDTEDMPDNMIYGLIELEAKPDYIGGTIQVTVFLEDPAPDGYEWYKYNTSDGWYDFNDYAKFNDARDQVTLTLTDGGVGDDDGIENGIIVDPSGLGNSSSSSEPSPPDDTTASSSGGGCFIATAAYGSQMEARVKILCEFRDRFLLTNPIGKAFVDFYYAFSPSIAEVIVDNDTLKTLVRWSLFPFVVVSWVIINLSLIPNSLLIFVFGLILIGLVRKKRKIRKINSI